MAFLVPDDLWAVVELLLPPARPKPKDGRPHSPDPAVLAGLPSVLRTGIQWHEVPGELGCSGKTCWRRLRDRREVRQQVHCAGHSCRGGAKDTHQ